MGFFDALTGMSPAQNQGLLAAAAALLQAGGPSRMPVSLGQALGGGLQAFQTGMNSAQDREAEQAQRALHSQMLGLQIKGTEADLADRAHQRQVDRSIEDAARNAWQTPEQQAASLPGGPTIANAAMIPQMKGGFDQQRFLSGVGQVSPLKALEYAQQFAKMSQKKVKDWQPLNVDGQVKYVPLFEDGSSGSPVAYEVARKLEARNTGGTTDMIDPYTGEVKTSVKNTVSPDAESSSAVQWARLNYEKEKDKQPVLNSELGGWVTRPDAVNPNGRVLPVGGASRVPKMSEDQGKATGWLVQAENAFKNMMAVGADKNGNPTGAARPGFNDALASVPGLGGLANTFRTADRQKFMQASSSLSEALLRAATGAGVNRDEAAQKVAELTPQFGEAPEVTKQKYAAIPLYIESLKVRAGPGANLAAGVLANQPAAGVLGVPDDIAALLQKHGGK
jgi:Sec-independent protein translocase protein TatA